MKVIALSDYSRLAELLSLEIKEYAYILVDFDRLDIEDIFVKTGLRKTELREGLGNIDFKNEYINFIGRLNKYYNSIYWWANTVSYKGTFASDLCTDIFNYYCLVSLIKRRGSNYIILSKGLVLNAYIEKYCSANGIEITIFGSRKKKNALSHVKKWIGSSLYFLLDGWFRKSFAFIYFNKNVNKLKKDKHYYVIRSWIDRRSFAENNRYGDIYFGRLPDYLKERQKEYIVLAGILTGYKKIFKELKKLKQYVIVPQEYFVGYIDYLKVIISNAINRPKILKPALFCGLEVTDLLKAALDKDYECGEVNKNLIYYYYVKGVLKKIKIGVFAFPFENHSWEKMSMFAVRKYSPSTKVLGYVHSTLRPYLLNYFYSKDEEDVMPFADKIVTTGKEPKILLQENGNYKNKIEVSEGCALRYEYIFKKNDILWDKKGKILVTLSMDISCAVKLLKFLYDALADKNKYEIVLRAHPFTPLDMITRLSNIRLSSNFQVSKNKNFNEDLKNTALLIYTNATTGVEALTLGIPVVYVDLKPPLNMDPLFKLDFLKWVVSDKEDLCNVIDRIYNMGEAEHQAGYRKALSHLRDYFYPVEEKYLQEFMI